MQLDYLCPEHRLVSVEYMLNEENHGAEPILDKTARYDIMRDLCHYQDVVSSKEKI